MTTGTLHVVDGRSGEVRGYMVPEVGMQTQRGPIIRVTARGYTTQSKNGIEYRYVRGTVGASASMVQSEARKWGWKK
jgi:hypothetical protein